MGGGGHPEDREEPGPGPHEVPIEDHLDLHPFHPRDAQDVVREYLEACRARGFREVRIIHGRGSGALRETVRATLAREPGVVAYRDADPPGGGWGATVVELAAAPIPPADPDAIRG